MDGPTKACRCDRFLQDYPPCEAMSCVLRVEYDGSHVGSFLSKTVWCRLALRRKGDTTYEWDIVVVWFQSLVAYLSLRIVLLRYRTIIRKVYASQTGENPKTTNPARPRCRPVAASCPKALRIFRSKPKLMDRLKDSIFVDIAQSIFAPITRRDFVAATASS